MKKSMIEVAYQVLTNNDGAMPFVDLWKDVSQEMGFSQTQFEDNIAQFYTDLSLDGRFLNMSQNTWDLRSRHTYSESVMAGQIAGMVKERMSCKDLIQKLVTETDALIGGQGFYE